jgi:ferredoxin
VSENDKLLQESGASTQGGYTVHLARQNRTIDIDADVSLLDALEFEGVIVPSVCREGVCGTCECAVLEGEVDHRDQILGPEERSSHRVMMVCVSRAKGTHLVLDL